MTRSTRLEELVDGQVDVGGDPAKQGGRDVATGVEGNRCRASVRMPELLLGAALTHLREAESLE